MKKLIIAGISLGLAACASTHSSVEEVTAAYHTELNAPDKENLRKQISDSCDQMEYRQGSIKGRCYISGDVIVHEYRLAMRSMYWTAQAAASVTKDVLEYYCENPRSEALKYGFGLLVDLQGRNGFVGKVKSYDDCLTL